MAEYQSIIVQHDGPIARITLNRPDRLNSFTAAMHEELKEALNEVAEARVIVLTGAGRGFCAGQDLNDRAVTSGEHPVDLGMTVETAWNPLVRKITSLPQPVIARVNGVAAGAGANIALACDMVVAARSAKFIQSFSAIGLIPDSGGTWALPRLVGQARAMGLALTGDPLTAEKAEEWGLIWKCVDDEALDAEVDAIAQKLASLPPLGLAAIKEMIRSSWSHTLDQELNHQRDAMRRLGFSEDYREGVAAFLEKRQPNFVGR
jgi:2-(1,2-epoxy-1,2-dihydrophenyl)acetyl-CoA isomerase